MAISNGTYLTNLVNPQVLADMIDKKLVDAIKFAPLADIDYTLAGRPGDTITLPSWNYIGAASVTAEGENITIHQLTASTVSASVHKLGIGVQITDEAVLSGYGDPIGEAVRQETLSIAAGVDDEVLAILGSIASAMTASASSITPDAVNDALELFGEDIDGTKVVLVDPTLYTAFRKADDWLPASEIAADRLVRGAVGEAFGCQVIVTNKLKGKDAAYIVKPGALRIFLKRDTLVETDRNIVNKSTIMTADKHFVAYLYDASKAIKVAKSS